MYWELCVEVVVAGYGSVFVTYFMQGPVRDYRNLLRNDAELFTAYRLEQLAGGVLEVPLNSSAATCPTRTPRTMSSVS